MAPETRYALNKGGQSVAYIRRGQCGSDYRRHSHDGTN
jgi:hypothetical protein